MISLARLTAPLLALLWSTLSCAADLLIENATVIAVQPAKVSGVRNVLIRDGRIAVISEKPVAVKFDVPRVNGRGKYLTPGLMDSHVHVSDAAGIPVSNDIDQAALRAQYLQQQPRSYLYFGVTQLLDPANSPDGIATFNAQPQHPDLFRCGAAWLLGGYPLLLMDEAARSAAMPMTVYEPANAKAHPLPGKIAADHTPAAVVGKIAATDARCVKVFIEDGFGGSSDWPLMSPQTLRDVVTAAHKHGLPVLAHANSLGMQQRALDAGADVLAHGLWNWDGLQAKTGLPPQIATHLRLVRERKVGLQPTLRVLYGLADLFRHDTLLDPMYGKVVPPAVLAWYGSTAGQWYKRAMRKDYDGLPDTKIMQLHFIAGERGMRIVKDMAAAGYPLLLASDTPSAPTYGNQPGYDTYREMRAMAQSGVSLEAILQSATINNARQFRLERDYGSVEVGKIANLLLLNANPLESVRAWSLIDQIVLRGVVIPRESLAANR